MGFMERFLYFMMGVRGGFLYISNKKILDVDMETWWHVDTWFLGIWNFVEMWIFVDLYVGYPTVELSSFGLFSWDIKEEIMAFCLFLGQKGEETLQLLFWWLDIHMLMIIFYIGYFEIHVDMWLYLIWIWIYIGLFGYTCWYIMHIQLFYTGATNLFVCEILIAG